MTNPTPKPSPKPAPPKPVQSKDALAAMLAEAAKRHGSQATVRVK